MPIFQCVWTIAGGFAWIFSLKTNNFAQHENPQLETYCHPNLYAFTYVIIVVSYCLMSLVTIFISISPIVFCRKALIYFEVSKS